MKYLQTYNESIRDQMIPKTKEEILSSVTNPTAAMMDQIDNSDINDYNNKETIDNIKLLLDNGADVTSNNYALLRFVIWVGDLGFVKELIEEYKIPADVYDDTALTSAAQYNKPEILQYLIDKGANVKESGNIALEFAIDNALNNETPIINDVVLILIENGVTKEYIKDYLKIYFSDSATENIMKELEEKLSKRNGSK
jgi:ankyrin repeat protein